MLRRRLVFLSFAVTLALPSLVSAQASLVNGLGGPRDFGTSCLSGSDDGSSPAIDLGAAFPDGLNFFGTTQHTAYVNVNGNITFNGPQACYTPNPFPIAMQPMIAPFWGDVDLRTFLGTNILGGRNCDGPEGMTTCPPMTITSCSNPSSNGIWWSLSPGRMVVTWDAVGYYQCRDGTGTRNSFQLILTAVPGACGATTSGTDFDVEFRYNNCHWEAGEASGDTNGNGVCSAAEFNAGCVPAQAGFDAGNLTDFREIMGSRTRGIATALCSGSNTVPAQAGVWQFQVRGGVVMTCPNAGDPCTVPGQQGVCANGRLDCASGTSTATCVQQVTPNEERCDNQDNDCDGMVDETSSGNLCDQFQTCQAGACIDGCFEGTCPAGYTCDNDHCVDAMCIGVTCGAGERCLMGSCVQPCDGVTCPHGQSCVEGRCIDPCRGIGCDECTACANGACVTRCTMGAGCSAGQTCDTTSGLCVETACMGVTCTGGTFCRGGACVDGCEGATCPLGQACMAGECVQLDRPDAAVVQVDANIHAVDAGPPNDSGTTMTQMDAGATGTGDAGRRAPPASNGSCGCRVGARSSASWASLVGLAIVLGSVTRRARRRAR